jgi:hypothetical protein
MTFDEFDDSALIVEAIDQIRSEDAGQGQQG